MFRGTILIPFPRYFWKFGHVQPFEILLFERGLNLTSSGVFTKEGGKRIGLPRGITRYSL